MTYRVFTRTWWKEAKYPGTWPHDLEPSVGKSCYRGHPRGLTFEEAREYCQNWNATHPPGRYSLKAEFEQE